MKMVRLVPEDKQGHFGDHPPGMRGSGLIIAFQNVNDM